MSSYTNEQKRNKNIHRSIKSQTSDILLKWKNRWGTKDIFALFACGKMWCPRPKGILKLCASPWNKYILMQYSIP